MIRLKLAHGLFCEYKDIKETVSSALESRCMQCWLCENAQRDEAKHVHEFIVDRIHAINPKYMARSIVDRLTRVLGDSESNPPTESEVLSHIERHILHPQVRLGTTLRNLVELSEVLREVVCTRGEDDTPLVDVRAASLYLKVVSEVMQVYRTTEPSKLLFGSTT